MSHSGGGSRVRAWTMLGLLSVAELLGMSLWFTASAVSPQLRVAWGLTSGQAGWLTTTVLLGFVAGTAAAALLNLADVLPARRFFFWAALLAAGSNAALVLAPGYGIALLLRFLTGASLAGVYPPAMKMIATWFRARRGLAIGTIVGALTVGKALPYLFQGLQRLDHRGIILMASAGALIAALLVFFAYRDGPEPFARRPFSWGLVGTVVGDRRTRLAIGGYLGHMWELYAVWTALALFFRDSLLSRGVAEVEAVGFAGLFGFGGIAIGGLGSVLAGLWADRLGRENVASAAMLVSGSCALVAGWLIAAPIWVIVGLGLVWGFAVVADSAQFSALVTEVSPNHAVGTALTLQTSAGFLLSAVSIWLMIEVQSRFGWGVAFTVLAVGPFIGILQMLRLKAVKG